MSSRSDMLVSSKATFISSLFLISLYMWWILWNISQASLGSHCFALLWLKPETFIIPVLVFLFCPSALSSSLFTRAITLWSYLSAESGAMVFWRLDDPRHVALVWVHQRWWKYPLEGHVHLLFLLLPQCMLLRPWEGEFHVLLKIWQYFLLSSFLPFCS